MEKFRPENLESGKGEKQLARLKSLMETFEPHHDRYSAEGSDKAIQEEARELMGEIKVYITFLERNPSASIADAVIEKFERKAEKLLTFMRYDNATGSVN